MKKFGKKITILSIVLISMMTWKTVWAQDTLITITASPGQTVSYTICDQQYTQAIVYKPSWASSGISWEQGSNEYWQDSIIITPSNQGYWLFNSSQGAVINYVYFVSSPTAHPSMTQDTSFCTSSFSLMLDAGNLHATYLWSTGQTTQTIVVNSVDTYTVTITNACGTGIYSKNVYHANPNAPNLGADQAFCWGQTTTLDPGSTNVFSYQWSTGATTPTITVDTTGTYWVYLVDNNGCSGRDTVEIVSLLPIGEEICFVEFDTVTWKNQILWSSNIPGNAELFKVYREISLNVWDLLGTVNITDTSFIDMGSNPQAQSYSYKISVVDTCGNESQMSQHHTTITLLSTYDSGTNTYGFTWSPYQGHVVNDYYLFGIDGSNNITQIAAVPGNVFMYNYVNPNLAYIKYFVGFEAPNCGAKNNVLVKSNWVQSVITGVENFKNLNFSVFPNPANEKIEIQTSETEFEIELINIFGQVLLKEKNTREINVSEFSSGTYILRITGENFSGQQKVIVY